MKEVIEVRTQRLIDADKELREAKENLELALDKLGVFAAVRTTGTKIKIHVASIECIEKITKEKPIILPSFDEKYPFKAKGYIGEAVVFATITNEEYEKYMKKATAATVTGEKL